jgi:choline dehydrogenase
MLMQSSIGSRAELQRLSIPVVQDLPGVGQNFQDHFGVGCIWEFPQPLAPRNNASETTFFWKSDPGLNTPDMQTCQAELPIPSAETATRFHPPTGCWTLLGGVARPKS